MTSDQLDLLADVAATVEALPVPDAPTVWTDPVRGHLSVYDAWGVLLAGCDLGGVLDVWTTRGVALSPALARDLGAAFTAWGESRDALGAAS